MAANSTPKSPPRIVDIARELQLSNTAVGEILRGKRGYNKTTRRLVLNKAKQMGYRPNYLSRALAGGKSMTIGLLVHVSETPVFAEMVRSIEQNLRQYDYLSYILELSGEERNCTAHIRSLLDRRVDGLILHIRPEMPMDEVNELIAQSGVPVVRIGLQAAGDSLHAVYVQREQALWQMAQHLAHLGHRQAAYITTEYTFEYTAMKLEPYRNAFEAANVELDSSRRWMVEPGEEYRYGCLELICREARRGNLPTALVLNCDRFAFEAMTALTDAGIRVPEDISVVGFDDDYFARVIRPHLTTIRQPLVHAGKVASSMLLELLDDPEKPIENRTLDCELMVRDSTGPAPKR